MLHVHAGVGASEYDGLLHAVRYATRVPLGNCGRLPRSWGSDLRARNSGGLGPQDSTGAAAPLRKPAPLHAQGRPAGEHDGSRPGAAGYCRTLRPVGSTQRVVIAKEQTYRSRRPVFRRGRFHRPARGTRCPERNKVQPFRWRLSIKRYLRRHRPCYPTAALGNVEW